MSTPEQLLTRASQRLLFLDVARALAITLMVFAHFTDQLLDPAVRASAFGTIYELTRGFTAPMFFVVSGWTFAVVVLRPGASANFPRRLRRAALLLVCGYALTLPWWAEGFPLNAAPEVWVPFWSAGVLQSLGATLAIATVLLWCIRLPAVFVGVSAVLAVLCIAGGPVIQSSVEHWPAPLRGYLDARGAPGGFPLAPWAGYFFTGLSLGGALLLKRASLGARLAVLLSIAAAGFLAQPHLGGLHHLFALRVGWVALVLAITALAVASSTRLPTAIRILSRHALTFYVVHMLALWGSPWVPGLHFRVGPQLGWLSCALLTAACLLITGLGIRLAGLLSGDQRISSHLGDAANAARINPT